MKYNPDDFDPVKWILAGIVMLVVVALLMTCTGCATTHVRGDCDYVREMKIEFHCRTGGEIQHLLVVPPP